MHAHVCAVKQADKPTSMKRMQHKCRCRYKHHGHRLMRNSHHTYYSSKNDIMRHAVHSNDQAFMQAAAVAWEIPSTCCQTRADLYKQSSVACQLKDLATACPHRRTLPHRCWNAAAAHARSPADIASFAYQPHSLLGLWQGLKVLFRHKSQPACLVLS